jgi:phage shock protein A
MSTFERLREALRANLNDLLDRAARRDDVPVAEDAWQEARLQVREAAASLQAVEREAAAARVAAERAEADALAALRAGDEGLARRHVASRLASEAQARELESLAARERAYLDDLRQSLAVLDRELAAFRSRASNLEDGWRAADDAARAWSDRIDRLEAEAEALRDLWRDLRDAPPREPPRVEDALRKLKDELDKK